MAGSAGVASRPESGILNVLKNRGGTRKAVPKWPSFFYQSFSPRSLKFMAKLPLPSEIALIASQSIHVQSIHPQYQPHIFWHQAGHKMASGHQEIWEIACEPQHVGRGKRGHTSVRWYLSCGMCMQECMWVWNGSTRQYPDGWSGRSATERAISWWWKKRAEKSFKNL